MYKKLIKDKEINICSLQNKIIEKNRDLKIPSFCLFLGSGCSKNSGIPTSSELIKILQKFIFISRHEEYFSLIKKRGNNIYDYLNIISEFISKNSNDFNKFCMLIEQKFKNNIELNFNKYFNNIPNDLFVKYKDNKTQALKSEIINIVFEDTRYSKWFEEYSEDPRQRQQLIEELIENKDPGGSYIFLANIINKGVFNNIFTTNFDDLINDSLLKYVDVKSKVYAHNEIAKYISVYSKKPNIIKLHGDFLFESIKNTSDETQDLEDNLKFKLNESLKCQNLIVVGYSGYDNSVMNTLKEIKKDTSFQLVWCITKEDFNNDTINWRVFDIINNYNNSFYLLIDDFDTLIFNIWSKSNKPLKDLLEISNKRILLVNEHLKKFENQNIKNSSSITKKEKENYREFLNSQEYLKDAFYLMTERRFKEAKNRFDKALKIDVKNPNSYYGRSLIHYFLGNSNKALKDINQAITLDSNENSSYYSIRAKIYISKNQIDRALKDLNKLFSLAPNDNTSYNTKAMIYLEKGQYDIALASINTAIKIKEDPADYFIRARIYRRKNEYQKALNDINKAIGMSNFIVQYELQYIEKIKILILLKKYTLAFEEFINLNKLELNDDLVITKYILEIIVNIMLNNNTGSIWLKLEKLIRSKALEFSSDIDYLKEFSKKVENKIKKEELLTYLKKVEFYNKKS